MRLKGVGKMRNKWLFLFVGLIFILLLTGCGAKSKEDVTQDLSNKVEKLKGYKADAKMTLQMGTEPQEYEVQIWHNKPNYYRVNLKNAEKEQNQMILRNKEGVFVLTPALNKSFKFQSDWPNNSSQAYLYESLVKDILEDKEAKFKETEKHYVFETKTRYQYNKMLPLQEIRFNKKDLSPVSVKVMDQDRNALLTVEFSKVEFDAKFDDNAFDMKKNMTSAQLEVAVSTEPYDDMFTVKYPSMELEGVELISEDEFNTDNGRRVVLTYGGKDKSFTLIQDKVEVLTTASISPMYVNGDPVDLGFTVGAMTENSITWMHDGVEYMLASNSLSPEELVMVARSVQETIEK
jgi:outer membrane lipoprotein-sorting protein